MKDLENACSSRSYFIGSILFPPSMCSCLGKQEGTRRIEGILWRARGKGKEVGDTTTASALGAEWNCVWKFAVRGR